MGAEGARRLIAALLRFLHRAADAVAVLMFAAVFLIFVFKIGLRYIGHDSMAWADEVSIILFIWIVFWADALVLRERDHIRFDLLYVLLPPAAKRGVALARVLLLGGIFAYAFPPTLDYVQFLWREKTAVLQWRLDLVYLCFPLFVAAVVVRAAAEAALLLSSRWRSAL